MRAFFTLVIFLVSISVSSQELLMDTEDVHPSDVIEAKFNGGGIEKFGVFLNQNVDKSKVTKAGKLVFSFTISETGEIKNIKILEFPNIEIATEYIRVIKLAPKWQPAKRGGKPISLDIKYPVNFRIRS